MDQIPPADDLSSMLSILPDEIRGKLESDSKGLIEVVMDLGRKPEARYFDKSRKSICDKLVSQALSRHNKHCVQFDNDTAPFQGSISALASTQDSRYRSIFTAS